MQYTNFRLLYISVPSLLNERLGERNSKITSNSLTYYSSNSKRTNGIKKVSELIKVLRVFRELVKLDTYIFC